MAMSDDQIKELRAACQKAKKKPLNFFYCLSDADNEPALVIGKNISSEVKALKKAAKKRLFVEGAVGPKDGTIEFVTENPAAHKFDKNLKAVFGKDIPDLKKAAVKAGKPSLVDREASPEAPAPAPPPSAAPRVARPEDRRPPTSGAEAARTPTPRPGAAPPRPPESKSAEAPPTAVMAQGAEVGFSCTFAEKGRFAGSLGGSVEVTPVGKEAAPGTPEFAFLSNKAEITKAVGQGLERNLQACLAQMAIPTNNAPIPGTLLTLKSVEIAFLDAKVGKDGQVSLSKFKVSAKLNGLIPTEWVIGASKAHKLSISGKIDLEWKMTEAEFRKLSEDIVNKIKNIQNRPHPGSPARAPRPDAPHPDAPSQRPRPQARPIVDELKLSPEAKRLRNEFRQVTKDIEAAGNEAKRLAKAGEKGAKLQQQLALLEQHKNRLKQLGPGFQKAFADRTGKMVLNEVEERVFREIGERFAKKAFGYLVPGLGWAMLAWDVYEIGKFVYDHYDQAKTDAYFSKYGPDKPFPGAATNRREIE